jgi:hypothetical protein
LCSELFFVGFERVRTCSDVFGVAFGMVFARLLIAFRWHSGVCGVVFGVVFVGFERVRACLDDFGVVSGIVFAGLLLGFQIYSGVCGVVFGVVFGWQRCCSYVFGGVRSCVRGVCGVVFWLVSDEFGCVRMCSELYS